MREIKFRAWDKKHNFMISPEDMYSYDEFISSLGKVIEIEAWSGYSGGGFNENDVTDERIVMQYTGLTDRNGKEIYESDVVGCESNGVNRYEHRVICYDTHQAKYKSVPISAYLANAGNGGWTGYELREECEVIGNIYANPELVSA